MRRKLCVGILTFFLLAGCPAGLNHTAQADIPLAENGKTSYVIALANDAIAPEKTAAEQLQKYLQQVTGATFTIEAETAVKADTPQILVGSGARAKGLLPQQDWASLGKDGIVIKSVGNTLILAGGRPRGTLYAVFQFLEDAVGCRWWTPTEHTIPRKNTLRVPQQDVSYVPPFDYRENFTTATQIDPVFATKMRTNGHTQRQTAQWGGHYTILGFAHTFGQLLPPVKYFKDNPQWYSDPNNGNKPCTAASRMPGAADTQLNLSDPGVLDELTKQALLWIEKNPEAGYISISINDNHNYCHDEASMKLAEAEGSHSAPLIDFVNKVAARIGEKYPGFMVETLAYNYTVTPPKTLRPAKNVIIRLAPSGADFGHPIDSFWNEPTRDNISGWSKIADNLFLWNYVTNFEHTVFPYPNWEGLGPDLRFFVRNNVKGVFQQGDAYTDGVGDFVQLRAWLNSYLLWNPNLNQDELTYEFLQGYYGAAAPYLQQYLDLVQESFLSQNRKLRFINDDFSYFDLETTNEAIRLFQQAANAVKGDKTLAARVHRESLALNIAVLFRYHALKEEAAQKQREFLGPQDPHAAMLQYIADAQSYGIRSWKERYSFGRQIPRLEDMFAPPAPLPDFARNQPKENVLDIHETKFTLYGEGNLTNIVKEAVASNGRAATILGDSKDWAIQIRLDPFLGEAPEKVRVYVMARLDTKEGVEQEGISFATGIYDRINRRMVSQQLVPTKDFAGSTYQAFDMGEHQLNGGKNIYFVPTQNPAVTKIYIDRVILIKAQ